MRKEISRTVGSGITERQIRKTSIVAPIEPEDEEVIRAAFDQHNRNILEPWAGYASVIAAVRRDLAEIKENVPDVLVNLAEYESTTWYLHAINTEAKIVEFAVSEGRPWEAVAASMKIGELLTELRMKTTWEVDALYGRKHNEARAAGSAKTRRQPAEVRIQFVQGLLNRGKSVRNSFKIAGKHFGVSAGAIQTDWYGAKKSSQG